MFETSEGFETLKRTSRKSNNVEDMLILRKLGEIFFVQSRCSSFLQRTCAGLGVSLDTAGVTVYTVCQRQLVVMANLTSNLMLQGNVLITSATDLIQIPYELDGKHRIFQT